jgi:hypothetical protein
MEEKPSVLALEPGAHHDKGDEHALASFCRETFQVERAALLRTLVERATERAFHLSSHLASRVGGRNKAGSR